MHLGIASGREEGAVEHRVEEPVPVFTCDVRDEPGEALAVEVDLVGDARLDEPVGVDAVTVQLETGIVKDEIDTATLHVGNELPETVEVVTENVLFGSGKVFTSRGLEVLDVIFGHVDEERQVGSVTPEADLGEFVEEKLASLELFVLGSAFLVGERFGETGGKLKDGRVGARESIALLSEKDIVVLPVLGDTEALMQSAVLVRFGKQPRGVHEVFATEELGNLLVPEGDVSLAIVNDGTKLGVLLQILHEGVHAFDALCEVEDLFFLVLLIEGLDDIVDSLAENGRQTLAHGLLLGAK